ncbi:MAG: primosomal protein N' [Actinomycetaceae bacterium]|nr:primosomal protein N' [Actinomycetaceae bacterium]
MKTLPGFGELPEIGEQGALLGAQAPARTQVAGDVPNPVAHVHVELHQPHLDRVFDYLIPAKFDAAAVVGARVVVDVAGLRAPGFIVARDSRSAGGARLRPLRRVVSALPVLTPQVYELAQQVAARQASSVSDVLSLAVPQRHARAEKEHMAAGGAGAVGLFEEGSKAPLDPGVWSAYVSGPAFVSHVAAGDGPSAVCCALPGAPGGVEAIVAAVRAARASGRGALIVVPSSRQALGLAARLREGMGEAVAVMLAEEPHEARYATFLRVLSGAERIVVGTRSAVWAPVPGLGLCVVVDDAAPSLREVRSPYCQARDVLATRAANEGAAFLVFSTYVSVESAAMIRRGQAALVEAAPASVRQHVPRVSAAQQWQRDGDRWSRLPEAAFSLVRRSLERGPVLVLVPRAGYIPIVACASCSHRAECATCGGALGMLAGGAEPVCERCGARARSWRCQVCGSSRLRAVRLGSHRTAEEVGRAFPGTGIILSGARTSEGIVESVSAKPRIVVATPGAEPWADGGYAAALVLDSRYLLGQGPGSQIEFLRRITRVASRVRPAREGGHVMFAGGVDDDVPELLGSWALPAYSAAVLSERAELDLPPAARWLAVTGRPRDLRTYLAMLRSELYRRGVARPSGRNAPEDALLAGGIVEIAEGFAVLGPVPGRREGEITGYIRTALDRACLLAEAGRSTHREYAAKQLGALLRLEVDPLV